MAEPYLGEIRLFSFGTIPKGWLPCNGQLLNVNSNQALFAVIGAAYGGNGQTTFALPNLQNSVPISSGNGYQLGQVGGAATVTLTQGQNPTHTHTAQASTTLANTASPGTSVMLGPLNGSSNFSNVLNPQTTLASAAVSSLGGASHPNVQPSQVLNLCIAIQGLFPPRS